MSYSELLGRPENLHLNPLLDVPRDEGQPKIVSGRHLSKLYDARTYARKEIDQLLDIPVPDAVFKRGYLFEQTDIEEYDEYSQRFNELLLKDPARLKALFGYRYWSEMTLGGRHLPSSSHLRDRFQYVATQHLKKSMVERLQELDTKQVMTIQEALESPPTYSAPQMGTDQDFDCAIQTFAMNTATLMDHDNSSCSMFDATSFRKTAELDHPHRPHDLPWLLGSLATSLAAKELGHDIRVRTFVGADFGEIEERYIKPIRQRSKVAKFILSTMLASSLQGANHFVIVTAADEDRVHVTDPKRGVLDIPSQTFWENWVPTNMQASLVIAIPHDREMV